MKRKFPHAASAAIATLFCLIVSGCESDTTVIDPEGMATVVLKRESVSTRSFTVTFTPSENTVRYRYAVGRETDRAAFEAGTLAGTAEQEGAESRTVEFTGLVPQHTYVPNEHTVGVLYEILEADWWDGFVESADYYEGWLPQYLMYKGYWKYTPAHETFTYTEKNSKPGTRYYAAACPINANGAAGFGETTLEEFTTLEQ